MKRYTATPSHDVTFMHNLHPVHSPDYDTLVKLMAKSVNDFMYIEHKPTGEPFPKTFVFPEIKWVITEEDV